MMALPKLESLWERIVQLCSAAAGDVSKWNRDWDGDGIGSFKIRRMIVKGSLGHSSR